MSGSDRFQRFKNVTRLSFEAEAFSRKFIRPKQRLRRDVSSGYLHTSIVCKMGVRPIRMPLFRRRFKPVSQHVTPNVCCFYPNTTLSLQTTLPFSQHISPTVNVAMSYELLMLSLVGGSSLLFKMHKSNTLRSFRVFLFSGRPSLPSSDTVSTLSACLVRTASFQSLRTSQYICLPSLLPPAIRITCFPDGLASGSPPDAPRRADATGRR